MELVLGRLERVKRSGAGWTASCPAHDDRTPSLSITEGNDGRVLLHCFAGCPSADIVHALGLTMAELFPEGGGGRRDPSRVHATLQHPSAGYTLEAYAEAKKLPEDFLRELGLSTISYLGAPALRIPYYDPAGKEADVRFRLAADGESKFRWRKGSKTMLYGLERLAHAREEKYVILAEGESDTHTLWLHGFPAIGVPGASTWNEKRDAGHFAGVDVVYVLVEPDRGGETVLGWLAASGIRDRVRLVRFQDVNDVSDLYAVAGTDFRARFEQALENATSWTEHERRVADDRRASSWTTCSGLAQDPDILARFAADLRALGLVGEAKHAKLVYLAMTSRLLDGIVSVVVKGPSSGGKSYLVETVLRFFTEEADFYARTGMSEKALIFGEEDLRHRMIVVFEATGLEEGFQAYAVRSLLSEGRISYEVTEKGEDGKLSTRIVVREGPTGLIVTTTAVRLHPENETRLLSISINDTSAHTKEIFRALAQKAAGTRAPDDVGLDAWRDLQRWLATGPRDVVIPFASQFAELVPPAAVRLRRDLKAVFGLVKAHALLHSASRPADEHGRIAATLEDYEIVREIVAEVVAEGVERTVPRATVETVEAVRELLVENDHGVSVTALATRLGLDKSTASRRWNVARDRGYLRNLESQKGRPARIVLGDPLPKETEVLPTVEMLREAIGETVAVLQGAPESRGTPLPPRLLGDDGDLELQSALGTPSPTADQLSAEAFDALVDEVGDLLQPCAVCGQRPGICETIFHGARLVACGDCMCAYPAIVSTVPADLAERPIA